MTKDPNLAIQLILADDGLFRINTQGAMTDSGNEVF